MVAPPPPKPNAVVNQYTTVQRGKDKSTIKSYFTSLNIKEGEACMTQNKSLLKYVENHKLIGAGTFGNVYSVKIPKTNISVAIKEGRITVKELKNSMVKKYPPEYIYNGLINNLIENKVCPNFSYTYAILFCNHCTIEELGVKPINTQCSETIVELFNYTLDKQKDLRDEVVLSLLFQILFAIASIQVRYGMFHNDVKKENILVKLVPAGGYWVYQLDGITYYVPNYGYLAALNDFGVSIVYKPSLPSLTIHDYGRRQAKVVERGNRWFFEPFTTQRFPSEGKQGVVRNISPPFIPNTNKKLTWNHFWKNFDSKPSIPVDMEDMVTFPPYNFHYDVIDTIFMFIGGKRTNQSDYHTSMMVSDHIYDLLDDFYKIPKYKAWPVDRVDLFLASHTIKKLFLSYTDPNSVSGPKIENYSL